ncbi:carbon-phosphorus lyase complex subunit PhnI [Yersinia pseudotuberculosis]|uniref:carbon-phosphorus lyase complex subunit PhnI n=1 Tax=Yersinia pseudotuberculosis TaxID=633 RepID=UPI002B2C5FDA|nr:carbon-phosphorus lyase complex subunit PhnI [Yersinia pseudotuberculosis]
MYVAVKGGEKAIAAAHQLLENQRRGDTQIPAIDCEQIEQQLGLAVDRVMTEGGIYDRELAALAIKQASGDLVEAIFLLRAYRTTLPRLAVSLPLATDTMRLERRISAIYKDLPGGQVLGPTYDYTHRLLDFTLLASGETPLAPRGEEALPEPCAHVFDLLTQEQLALPEQDDGTPPDDITRNPPVYPCNRSARLQQLVRGDEGFLLALGYSTQRGYGRTHPFAAEIRTGYLTIAIQPEELGFAIDIGEILLTECEMVNGFVDPVSEPPHFTRGYGLVFGRGERKAMSIALMDRALQSREYQEAVSSPAQDEEFVLSHADNVEAAGFVSHLKLPHYVDFQAELALLKRLRSEHLAASSALFTPQLSSSSLPSSSSQPPSSQRQEPHHD